VLKYFAELDALLRALADPTRRAVVERLAQSPAVVSELAAPFDMALPSLMQHLRVLEDAGVITSRSTGASGDAAPGRSGGTCGSARRRP
jgi:DNA-binding transcriptional ArsR family regulator